MTVRKVEEGANPSARSTFNKRIEICVFCLEYISISPITGGWRMEHWPGTPLCWNDLEHNPGYQGEI